MASFSSLLLAQGIQPRPNGDGQQSISSSSTSMGAFKGRKRPTTYGSNSPTDLIFSQNLTFTSIPGSNPDPHAPRRSPRPHQLQTPPPTPTPTPVPSTLTTHAHAPTCPGDGPPHPRRASGAPVGPSHPLRRDRPPSPRHRRPPLRPPPALLSASKSLPRTTIRGPVLSESKSLPRTTIRGPAPDHDLGASTTDPHPTPAKQKRAGPQSPPLHLHPTHQSPLPRGKGLG